MSKIYSMLFVLLLTGCTFVPPEAPAPKNTPQVPVNKVAPLGMGG